MTEEKALLTAQDLAEILECAIALKNEGKIAACNLIYELHDKYHYCKSKGIVTTENRIQENLRELQEKHPDLYSNASLLKHIKKILRAMLAIELAPNTLLIDSEEKATKLARPSIKAIKYRIEVVNEQIDAMGFAPFSKQKTKLETELHLLRYFLNMFNDNCTLNADHIAEGLRVYPHKIIENDRIYTLITEFLGTPPATNTDLGNPEENSCAIL